MTTEKKRKYKNPPYRERFGGENKAKPLMIYVTPHEKEIFKKHAKKQSLSKFISNAVMAHIASSRKVSTGQENPEVQELRKEIALLKSEIAELKKPSQGVPDQMANRIFEHIKNAGTWITEQELHDIFNITTEEQHTDFTIAMHQLQFNHGYKLEFSPKYGWRYKK